MNRLTAEQARGLMNHSERSEIILNRLYKSIVDAAQRKKSVLFVGVRAFDNEVAWILSELKRDGFEARVVVPFLADEGITHVIKVKW